MDYMNKFLKFVDHERGKIIGVVLGITLVLCLYGCSAQIKSPISGEVVTRQDFKIEATKVEEDLNKMYQQIIAMKSAYNNKVEQLNSSIESADAEFTKIENFQESLLNIGSGAITTLASGGTVNAGELISSLIAAAGVFGVGGAVVDHARKNKVINKLKEKQS